MNIYLLCGSQSACAFSLKHRVEVIPHACERIRFGAPTKIGGSAIFHLKLGCGQE